jgi:hypothetical protein
MHYLLPLHGNNGSALAPQCHVVHTSVVMLYLPVTSYKLTAYGTLTVSEFCLFLFVLRSLAATLFEPTSENQKLPDTLSFHYKVRLGVVSI